MFSVNPPLLPFGVSKDGVVANKCYDFAYIPSAAIAFSISLTDDPSHFNLHTQFPLSL